MDDKTAQILFRFFNEIGIIEQLSRAQLEARLPDGMIAPHFAVLNHLTRVRDGQTPLALARAFQVPKTTMTHTLKGLEQHRLVEMRPNPEDGRSKRVWLTDQGRQYFAWRGKSRFQKLLIREGIEHVVSRAHHPQTLGKCERLWKTVGDELWYRARPQDLDEARRRLGHFFDHYNHFRPHQGIDGLVPADRFFGSAGELRESLAHVAAVMKATDLPCMLYNNPPAYGFDADNLGDDDGTNGW